MVIEPISRARLLALLHELSYEERDVVLASGAKSSFYLDCRQTALHPEGAAAIGQHLLALIPEIEARTQQEAVGVGGMSLGADPLATSVSLTAFATGRHLPAFLVRKNAKGHGTGHFVEGRRNLPEGSPVILVEDVITTGGSTLLAAERARNEGLVPIGVAVIVDRLAGGRQRLEEAGLATEALFTLNDFGGSSS